MSRGSASNSPESCNQGGAPSAAIYLTARLLTRHRELTWEMTKRELSDRYTGQVLGPIWVVGHPLLLMSLYVLLFAYIFPARTGSAPGSAMTVYVLAGL